MECFRVDGRVLEDPRDDDTRSTYRWLPLGGCNEEYGDEDSPNLGPIYHTVIRSIFIFEVVSGVLNDVGCPVFETMAFTDNYQIPDLMNDTLPHTLLFKAAKALFAH